MFQSRILSLGWYSYCARERVSDDGVVLLIEAMHIHANVIASIHVPSINKTVGFHVRSSAHVLFKRSL